MKSLCYLNQEDCFPAAHKALTDPNGLIAIGGDLQPERLLSAYQQGIFPWFNQGEPILWWTPDPRAVFQLSDYRPSRSLMKTLKRQTWRFTINKAFDAVIHQCAALRQEGTWITPAIKAAYGQLHAQGDAHSIEVWQGEQLVGGLYGIAVGKIFCGESMFHLETDASKAAFHLLVTHLRRFEFTLIDAQVMNPHLARLGAKPLPREAFLTQLAQLKHQHSPATAWQPQEVKLGY
ncbi:Leucyltransferase [Shewanella denitrificans OS217]|uniref:Leucyl/phenylalanyl-tRNA--protein transferase n=1 Tax=Shewanella denitrificans (strain OS217 / ATCC BAA-1090 / DSM 15013) TaxID=318161 RepID=LFTR_SHEDO|nr:leucyl/phenylalanyl-tRNA--protein transferase [Shewanella denitrificans]Q12N55.1 RecName: Full=Leucyl/phenylalanyl-tRNA--protein transferase; AltName: Full=L/F-transferase; AltName: Full=Leucyltransferase; AltName: Full=Phenyalanyltransferase [Shewanella denitrificans OS217]ABE55121.1 Leucyltransferase [Shewanella denitrificans OS217]